MAKKLEELDPGTPVRCADGGVAGEVRAVYATGESRVPVYLLVHWNARGEDTLVQTEEVLTIDGGVVVLRSSLITYADLITFDPTQDTMLHRLH